MFSDTAITDRQSDTTIFRLRIWWTGGAIVLVPGVLLLIIVGQGPTVLSAGADGGGLDIFSLIYQLSLHFPSLLETARYTLVD